MTHTRLLSISLALVLAGCGGGSSGGTGGTTGPASTPNSVTGLVTDVGNGGRVGGAAMAFSGFSNAASGFSVTNNIVGANVTGQFFSFSAGPEITFTVQ